MKTISCKSGQDFDEIVEVLKGGGVVILPTDTIYGLACDAGNQSAIDKIYRIKGRNKSSTLAVMVGGIEDIYDYAVMGDLEKKYIEEFLPGPVTVILDAKTGFKDNYSVDVINAYGAVRFRVVDVDCIQQICKKFGGPIALTSANKSKAGSYVGDLKYVKEQLEENKDSIDLLLDAGSLGNHNPSMVVDLTKTPYEIIRFGGEMVDNDIK